MDRLNFNKEQKLLHHLILHSYDSPMALGLFDGMAGVMLVLANYSRERNEPNVECVSDFLMEKIISHIPKDMTIGLAHGLAGIGWAIEYLIQNGYMKGCGIDLTEEIDKQIMALNIHRIKDESLDTGSLGLAHYVLAHMQGAIQQRKFAFDQKYLDDWEELLRINKAKNDTWKSLDHTYSCIIKGNMIYDMNPYQFCQVPKRVPMTNLGLRRGLAGYIGLHLLS